MNHAKEKLWIRSLSNIFCLVDSQRLSIEQRLHQVSMQLQLMVYHRAAMLAVSLLRLNQRILQQTNLAHYKQSYSCVNSEHQIIRWIFEHQGKDQALEVPLAKAWDSFVSSLIYSILLKDVALLLGKRRHSLYFCLYFHNNSQLGVIDGLQISLNYYSS